MRSWAWKIYHGESSNHINPDYENQAILTLMNNIDKLQRKRSLFYPDDPTLRNERFLALTSKQITNNDDLTGTDTDKINQQLISISNEIFPKYESADSSSKLSNFKTLEKLINIKETKKQSGIVICYESDSNVPDERTQFLESIV
jgi:hypothetical protein